MKISASKYRETGDPWSSLPPIAWLIKHPQSARPFYFGWEEGKPGWTADINCAIQSETKDEAEQFASDIGLADWIVVEHAQAN